MQFEEFQEKVQNSIRECLGETVTVQVKEVLKNNGIRLHGLILLKEGFNIAPTIYLESFYKEYKRGRELGDIVLEMIKYCDEERPVKRMDMQFFSNYEIVRKGIMLKLVNREKNQELLKQAPFVPFLNLAVVFYYSLVSEYIGNGSILIRNEHIRQWKIEVQTLYQWAFENTRQKLGYRIMDMREVVRGLLREQIAESLKQTQEAGGESALQEKIDLMTEQVERAVLPPDTVSNMYVLTNRIRNMGAVSMIYPEALQTFSETLGQSLYILPSSVHEVILVPDTGRETAEKLRQMVEEVNSTQMEPEDVLSDDIYYYDREMQKISLLLP